MYLAHSLQADLNVALKHVHPDPEAIEGERRGCTAQQILFALAKQQVRIAECKGWEGNWIIYGFVEGEQLAKTPQASRCKSVIVKRLLEGVQLFAHAGIMHRDLSPENIMVNNWDQDCEEIQVTFLDFGSAIDGLSQPLDDSFSKVSRNLPYAWIPPEARTSELLGQFKPYECLVDLRRYGSYDVWGVGSIAFWLSHSSNSSFASDKCLALNAYTCTAGVDAESSLTDLLAGEDSTTKKMLAVEPCCRPAAEALLGGIPIDIKACSQRHAAARAHHTRAMLESSIEKWVTQKEVSETSGEITHYVHPFMLPRSPAPHFAMRLKTKHAQAKPAQSSIDERKERAAEIHVNQKGSIKDSEVAARSRARFTLSHTDFPDLMENKTDTDVAQKKAFETSADIQKHVNPAMGSWASSPVTVMSVATKHAQEREAESGMNQSKERAAGVHALRRGPITASEVAPSFALSPSDFPDLH